jgi:hypothetical protein
METIQRLLGSARYTNKTNRENRNSHAVARNSRERKREKVKYKRRGNGEK